MLKLYKCNLESQDNDVNVKILPIPINDEIVCSPEEIPVVNCNLPPPFSFSNNPRLGGPSLVLARVRRVYGPAYFTATSLSDCAYRHLEDIEEAIDVETTRQSQSARQFGYLSILQSGGVVIGDTVLAYITNEGGGCVGGGGGGGGGGSAWYRGSVISISTVRLIRKFEVYRYDYGDLVYCQRVLELGVGSELHAMPRLAIACHLVGLAAESCNRWNASTLECFELNLQGCDVFFKLSGLLEKENFVSITDVFSCECDSPGASLVPITSNCESPTSSTALPESSSPSTSASIPISLNSLTTSSPPSSLEYVSTPFFTLRDLDIATFDATSSYVVINAQSTAEFYVQTSRDSAEYLNYHMMIQEYVETISVSQKPCLGNPTTSNYFQLLSTNPYLTFIIIILII